MNILHSNIVGSGDDHFIILHGFLGMGDNWKTHAKQLAEKGYCVHLVDQRNHGKSFWSDKFDYEVMANDLLQYLNHHGIEQGIVLGHSMGGKTAMAFASAISRPSAKTDHRRYCPQILCAPSPTDFGGAEYPKL